MTDSSALEHFGRLLREAGGLAQRAREKLQKELKPDGSVVTNGDRLVEEFLRERLPSLAPVPIWGEEFGFSVEGPSGLWTVDPVDGTTNYAFGSPLWGVTAALVKGPSVVLGGIFLPDLDELFVAARGQGAFFNGSPMEALPAGPILAHETVSYCDHLMRRFPGRKWPGKMRCTGSFVVEAAFVALQRFRGLIGVREKLYDIAGALAVCGEIGADIRYADGSALDLEELKKGDAIAKPWLVFPPESGFFIETPESKGPPRET